MINADKIANGFLSFLASKKLDYLLPEILNKLNRYAEQLKETAYVTSAVALNTKENDLLEDFLKKEFGRNLTVKLKIDPQILGGLKIIVGDRMIDQTIIGKLSAIVEKIES